MPDMATIAAAISSLNSAVNIARGMVDLRDSAKIRSKVIELQSAILSAQSNALAAQSDQSLMLQRIRDLEEEVARVKAWNTEKEKYELKETQPGFFAYAIKENARGTEPAHLICASCYQKDQKSILQKHTEHSVRCPDCKSIVDIRRPNWPGPDIGGRGGGPNSWMGA
jgi:hypothetical protein